MTIKIICNDCGAEFYRNRISAEMPCPKCKSSYTEPSEKGEIFKKKRRFDGETDEAIYR